MYVNQSYLNFHAMRYPDMLHVFLSHGESEKTTYMASNQAKAYDFMFVAGEAAVQRYRKSLVNFDAEAPTCARSAVRSSTCRTTSRAQGESRPDDSALRADVGGRPAEHVLRLG